MAMMLIKRMATKNMALSTNCQAAACLHCGSRLQGGTTSTDIGEESVDLEGVRGELSALGGEGSIVLDRDDSNGLAVITIQHERRKNALSPSMMVQLSEAVSKLEQWETGKGLLLWGGTNCFCSGGDLSFIGKHIHNADAGRHMSRFMADVTGRMHRLPLISAAVVCGPAIGGGAELTTACDFRLMADGASMHWAQARMGLSPGWGGGGRLVKLLGRSAALGVLSGDRVLGTEEATRLRLCDATLGPAEGALEAAKGWLERMTRWDAKVVHALKEVASADDGVGEVERQQFLKLWGGASQRAALLRRDTQLKEKL